MIKILFTLQTESASVDADIQKEYSRQREHLERSVASLRKKLAKDSEIHRADNVRIMQVTFHFSQNYNFNFFPQQMLFLKKKKTLLIIIGPVKQKFQRNIVIIFLSISLNMCFGSSKEPSH